jgi:release factor glutamine methyltransferase
MDIYEPAEDSHLLEKFVRKEAFGRVLDMGTGSGIQAEAAASSSRVREVVAVDINHNAVKNIKQNTKLKSIQSDLFTNVTGKFNTIIFNAPYLPQDKGIEDSALYGGKHGWEISERFFSEASKHLIGDGIMLFLFSTLTNKEKIEEIIHHNLLEFEEIDSLKIAFETLYVYKIQKSELLRELEGKSLENISYFTHGKRGTIYTATLDKSTQIKTHFATKKIQKIAIKVAIDYPEKIEREFNTLKTLNKEHIGPKILFSGSGYFTYHFIEGDFILGWIQKHTKQEIILILHDILHQCRILDKIGVTKEEMHHPFKHILIDKNNQAHFIDFERCSRTDKPKNVTQCIEFFCRIKEELESKNIKINVDSLRELASGYKEDYSQSFFVQILKLLH